MAARSRCSLATIFVAAFAALLAVPRNASAACMVTATGTVNWNTDTSTTHTTNIDGSKPSSSDRTQRFLNGAAITGAIQPGVTVSGFGLRLTEKPGGKNSQEPITMSNQGQVTTGKTVNALQLDGGGPISYVGDGTAGNTANGGAGLFVDNRRGNRSIVTGAGALKLPLTSLAIGLS